MIFNSAYMYVNKMDKIISSLPSDILTKINKIGIAGYDATAVISLKRISRHMRVYMYYADFIDFMIQYSNDFDIITAIDETFTAGLIIVLLNDDILTVRNNSNHINNFIFERIGSDKNISSIILIKRCHNNTFIDVKDLLNTFNTLKMQYNWQLLQKIQNDNIGNSKWSGHYAIDTRGGHKNGIREGTIQLANNITDYCAKDISNIIKYKMVYHLLCADGSHKCIDEKSIEQYKKLYVSFCNSSKINSNNYLNQNGNLICCISRENITYQDFVDNKVQLCHIKPVSQCKIKYDSQYGFISTHHYDNLGWGLKMANMAQLDNSIEDTNLFVVKMTINLLQEKLANSTKDQIICITETIHNVKQIFAIT